MTELVGATAAALAVAAHPPGPNPYDVYLESLSNDDSRRTMRGCLDRIAVILLADRIQLPPEPGRLVPWGRLRYEHTSFVRSRLLEADPPLAPTYFNKHLSALRRVLKEAWRLELMSAEDYHRAADLNASKGSRLPKGRSLAPAEIVALLQVCAADTSPAGVRDAALIAVLQSTGGRRAEIASARREDYEPGSRTLRIIGKRNKERDLDLHEQAAVYLGRWLARLGRGSGPLFCPIDRWGNVKNAPLTPAAIGQIINRRRFEAELPALSAHDFRRTFVGDLLDEGVDLATAQQLAGHSSPKTTASYDRRPHAARKKAVERLASRLPHPDALISPEMTNG